MVCIPERGGGMVVCIPERGGGMVVCIPEHGGVVLPDHARLWWPPSPPLSYGRLHL
jgi:hypothetical protein